MSDPAVTAAQGDALVGATFGGRYTAIRRIRDDDAGSTYLARDVQERRDILLRALPTDWTADEVAAAHFEREARRLAEVSHPNVAPVLDHGREHGRAYLVMDAIEGERLTDLLARQGQLPIEDFVPIAAQVLKGVGHAHSRENLVRNIHPDNIMLSERKGRANFVRLLDFGVAGLRRASAADRVGHAAAAAGFVAPEVIERQDLDLRADVYALGAVFFAMLSGRAPIVGGGAATVFEKTVHADPPDLRTLLPAGHGASDGLIALVQRCVERRRDARPRDANELVEELIDVAPASLFRLRRVAPAPVAPGSAAPRPLPPGSGNTGMVELIGAPAVTGPLPAVPVARAGQRASAGAQTLAGEPAPAHTTTLAGEPAPAHTTTLASEPAPAHTRTLVLIALAAAVMLVVSVVGSWLGGEAEPSHEIASAPADADAPETRVAPSAAGVVAPQVAPADEPADTQAAEDAATSAPVADPAHQLPTEPTKPQLNAELATARVRSRPLANLQIDDTAMGTTPFRGELAVGRHRVRLTARGYVPWVGTIDVGDGAEPLRIALKPRKAGAGPVDAAQPAAGTPQMPSAPESAPPAAASKPKSDVFLPTPKSGKGKKGVFLPTKD